MIRAVFVFITLLLSTLTFGGWVLLAGLFRVRDGIGSPYDRAPRYWGRTILWVSGVTLVQHDKERKLGDRHIFAVNHVANYDVLAVAASLRWIKFVAKAELSRSRCLGRQCSRRG